MRSNKDQCKLCGIKVSFEDLIHLGNGNGANTIKIVSNVILTFSEKQSSSELTTKGLGSLGTDREVANQVPLCLVDF